MMIINNMKQIFKILTAIFVLTLSISLITSCSFDDEIQIDPGVLIIYNPSVSSYEITIKSLDENSQEVNQEFWLTGQESTSFYLEKGYSYEVTAFENNPEKTQLNTIKETVVIGPHQPSELYLPAN